MQRHKHITGFTLIELAIVLFIIGLLLGGFLAPLANKIEFENRQETQVAMEEIKDILLGFAMETGYLPCPDTDGDGVENLVTAAGGAPGLTCASESGQVPAITIGVNGEDAWDNAYIYRVDDEFADRSDPPNTDGKSTDACASTANISFALCSTGNITVLDSAGGNTIANLIPALLISSGQNWAGTASTDEAENTDGDAVFVQRNFSSDDANEFDDIVLWLSPHILRNRMVEAGVLP